MKQDELFWAAEGKVYCLQRKNSDGTKWELDERLMTLNEALRIYTDTSGALRLVRISRYLPRGTSVPTVMEIIRAKEQ